MDAIITGFIPTDDRPLPEQFSIHDSTPCALAKTCPHCRDILLLCIRNRIPFVSAYRDNLGWLHHLLYPSALVNGGVDLVDKKIAWHMRNGRAKIVDALWDAEGLDETLVGEFRLCIKKLDSLISQVEELVK